MKMALLRIYLILGFAMIIKLSRAETPPLDAVRKPATELEIRFTALVYRHGDRTPIDPYPTDPWKPQKYWPVKFGQLTFKGVRQHFQAGQYFRRRYAKLLSDNYDPDEICVVSTNVDRTIMSAEANLAGMYPAKGAAIWNSTFRWNPVPVRPTQKNEDPVLAMDKDCKAYNTELESYKESNEYQTKLKNEESLMRFLARATGRIISSFVDIEYIYNTLFIERLYNLTLPPWTTNVFPDKMIKSSLYSLVVPTATPKLARLKVGPFMKELTDNMKTAISNPKKSLKMKIYSAHDNTIVNILHAMNLYRPHFPSYTATIHFELVYDNATQQNSVRVLYRNSTELLEPVALVIPDCGIICPFDSFVKRYQGITPQHWIKECEQKSAMPALIIIGLLAIILAVILSREIFYYYADVAAHRHEQNQVPKPPEDIQRAVTCTDNPVFDVLDTVVDVPVAVEVPLLFDDEEVDPTSVTDATSAPVTDITIDIDNELPQDLGSVPFVTIAPDMALAMDDIPVQEVALNLEVAVPEAAVAVEVVEQGLELVFGREIDFDSVTSVDLRTPESVLAEDTDYAADAEADSDSNSDPDSETDIDTDTDTQALAAALELARNLAMNDINDKQGICYDNITGKWVVNAQSVSVVQVDG